MSFNNVITKIMQSTFTDQAKAYAVELMFKYKEEHGTDLSLLKRDTEKVLLSGAKNWKQYSEGGLSLIALEDIKERISPTKDFDSDTLMHLQLCYLEDAYYLITRII